MKNNICVLQDITGIEKIVKIDSDFRVSTCDSFGKDDFVVSKRFHKSNLEDILQAINIDIQDPVGAPLRKSYESIYSGGVDWYRALGKERFVKIFRDFLLATSKEIDESGCLDYLNVLREGREILSSFQRIQVDNEKLFFELENRDSSILRTLVPQNGNLCSVVRYSHKSQTGRMTVKEGPKVLLLQKDDRKFFMPSNDDNILAQIDFVSLEPRVAFLMTHNESERDVYSLISRIIGKDISRAKIKVATISTLYGSGKIDEDIMKEVRSTFNVKEIMKKIGDGEKIKNLYGRPLAPDSERLRLPHYIQSTAVDVSLLGFSKFYKENDDIIPYFMIHDSLVFECTKEKFSSLQSSDLYIDVEPLGRFYLSISKFNE